MTDITIPPEAVEAAARALYDVLRSDIDPLDWTEIGDWRQDYFRKEATAALRAGIAAWPGFTTEFRRDSFMGWNGGLIILPLPTRRKSSCRNLAARASGG